MIKDILTIKEDTSGVLHQAAVSVEREEIPALQKDIDDMIETMYASDGLGLAAPQIGLGKRIFVIRGPKNEPIVVINPMYKVRSKNKITSRNEGCLSCGSENRRDIRRCRYVKVAGIDREGNDILLNYANKTMNIAIQHEMDHLKGVLIVDK